MSSNCNLQGSRKMKGRDEKCLFYQIPSYTNNNVNDQICRYRISLTNEVIRKKYEPTFQYI